MPESLSGGWGGFSEREGIKGGGNADEVGGAGVRLGKSKWTCGWGQVWGGNLSGGGVCGSAHEWGTRWKWGYRGGGGPLGFEVFIKW